MISARNQIQGVIKTINMDKVVGEVVLQVGDGEIVSVITRRSLEAMDLKVGDTVMAVIKSTQVMIARP